MEEEDPYEKIDISASKASTLRVKGKDVEGEEKLAREVAKQLEKKAKKAETKSDKNVTKSDPLKTGFKFFTFRKFDPFLLFYGKMMKFEFKKFSNQNAHISSFSW